ncbi:hypothetical protein [Psychrobacter alimentarius]|uniref:hypothetical protein n=1 Tax=Psychrobacter alimentarius TaxID=261164 RepID=UPI003FCF8779
MALPAAVAPTLAVAALKEGLSLCQSIISYRIATQQIELQREHMHIEANAIMQRLDNEYKTKIEQLNTVASAHKITLAECKDSSADTVKMIEECQSQIQQLLNIVASTGISENLKINLITTVTQLSQQQAQLVGSHIQSSQAPINGFAMMLDGIRDNSRPRTFTDVS